MPDLGRAPGHARPRVARWARRGRWARSGRAGLVLVVVGVLTACSGQSAAPNMSGRVLVTTAAYQVPGATPAPADTAVPTQRGSSSRVGWNSNETVLNDRDVNARDFGKVMAYPVDGKIY